MDKVSQEVRSRIMRSVRSTQNKSTEEKFRAALEEAGVSGWEVRPDMPFKPDFIFREQKVAIFIDGCFWHGCPTCANKKPATNKEYWTKKIARNQKRDQEASEQLNAEGWRVFRFWEHDIKQDIAAAVSQVARSLDRKIDKETNTEEDQ